MRNTSLWIAAALAVSLACGCKSESKPADQMGIFTCKQNTAADGSDSSCADSTDHFDAAVPVIHVTYRTADLPKSGDTYATQWIATDVGSAAPANTVIATVNNTVPEVPAATKTYTLNGYLTKPTNGWPLGTYRIEIKLGDKLVTSAKFAIH
ncbi:MAG TPA: hypothetical protein VGG74_28155 [Kofleriaceae bacterium]|jgi:hypothetical protein